MNVMLVFILATVAFVSAQGAEVCEDRKGSETCKAFKSFCKQTGDFGDLIRDDCQRTCGICHGPTAAPKPTTPPKPTKAPTAPHPTRKPGPPPAGCGVSPVHGLGIIGGHEAHPGAWPWIASLQYGGYGHFCGGTLLNTKWVLTAAHCVKSMTPSKLHNFLVILGSHDHSPFTRERSVQRRHIKRVIVHPLWNPPKVHQGDHALLELDHPVELTERVNLPCMPKEGVYPPLGKECVLAGWGSIMHPGNPVNVLQETTLPVVEGKNCPQNPLVVCVGKGFGTGPDGKQWPNACRGDSGGPLVCQRSDGRWQLEGVASFVYTYCKYYTGYSPVNRYLSWINGYINK